MKLLFDHNLSPRVVSHIEDIFPGSEHVSSLGLERARDDAVWQYAHQHGYTIVSRDADFTELSVLRGFPPKVVWIRRGNCTTDDIKTILRENSQAILALENDPDMGVLALF